MRYLEYPPAPDLARIVERYWVLEAASTGVQRIFPDGHAELVFHLGDRVRGQADTLLIGQMTRWVDILPEGWLRVFGVRLRPEAAMRMLPLAGQIVDLAERRWRQELGDAANDAERVAVADRFVRERFDNWLPDRRVAQAGRLLRADIRMDEVAERIELSRRQLERLFAAHVGLEPKMFARITRFQRALDAERTQVEWKWTRIAQECGYYDQAHLIADFREFTGAAPTARPETAMGEQLAARA